MIKASAVLQSGCLFTGKRHCDAYAQMFHFGVKPDGDIQGFVTDDGKFLDRKEALKHAIACGQLKDKKYKPDDALTSEDLW